jgi:adenine phosphoribosyltransferase
MDYAALIRTIPDYPKVGIMFRDITTLLGDAMGLRAVVDALVERYRPVDIDIVAGIEARGFILGGAVAHQLGKGFVPIRKKGKLPWKVIGQEYQLEYGTDIIEMHEDAVPAGAKVLVVDDLIATGGTAVAAAQLIAKSGGSVAGACFIIDLPDLGGVARLETLGIPVTALCRFEGH